MHSSQRPPELTSLLGGVFRALGATVLWASSALLIDRLSAIYHLTALQISGWRVLLVVPVLVLLVALRRPEAFSASRSDLPSYAVSGLVGLTVVYVTWATSIQINKPAVAVALSFSAPAFVALGDRLVFGTPLHALRVGAIMVNLLGCGLVAGVYSPADLLRTPTGFAVGLGNGLAFSLYTLLGRSMARTGRRDPLTGLFYSFGFAAIGLVALGLVANGPRLFDLHLDLKGWLLLGGLALGPTLGSYALFNSSLKILPATLAILITTLEPPLVAVLASVLIGRAVKGVQWLGIGLIVAGVVAVQLGMRRDSAAIGEPELAEGFK